MSVGCFRGMPAVVADADFAFAVPAASALRRRVLTRFANDERPVGGAGFFLPGTVTAGPFFFGWLRCIGTDLRHSSRFRRLRRS